MDNALINAPKKMSWPNLSRLKNQNLGDRSGKKLKKSVELGEKVEVLEPGGGKDRFSCEIHRHGFNFLRANSIL